MAMAKIVWRREGTVCFTLSNKPQFECFIDEEDYQIVEHNTCWFIHIHAKNNSVKHVRRTVHLGNNQYTTESLHDFIFKRAIEERDKHIFHINTNGLDNRKNNLTLRNHE
jgi:hypothetical protein